MKVRITGLSDKGNEAISQHFKESKGIKGLMAKKFFKQYVMNEDPYILLVEVQKPFNKMLQFRDVKTRIIEALESNGAREDDYIVEEVSI